MKNNIENYEHIVLDKDFPVRLIIKNLPADRGLDFSAHWHEYVELHYIINGNMKIIVEGKDLNVTHGDMVVINSNVLHQGYRNGGDIEVVVIIFEREYLLSKNIVFSELIKNDYEISKMLMEIYREEKEKKLYYQLSLKSMLLKLIVYLLRNYAKEVVQDKDRIRRSKNLERLQCVGKYIEKNYDKPISNKELASLINVSENRFNHLFKEEMGISPLRYINEIRLSKAMKLLKKGEYSVTEVAEKVGFPDYNHFGRMFRNYFGYTPIQVKRNNEVKNSD